jgi:uncharacterized protein (DUF433 family)
MADVQTRAGSMPATAYAHIEIREGVPYLEGTQTKVIEVAIDAVAGGWDAAEIHKQHPHLSLGQIHGALAYYYDHKPELDRDIEDRYRAAEALRNRVGPQFTREELEARLRRRRPVRSNAG